MDPRTRALLEGPIAPTLLRLAVPNMLVLLAQAAAGLVETYFVGKLGTDALAGMALVFPTVMLMQMMSSGAMGGGIASAVARALGAGKRDEANAVVIHALVIAVGFGIAFTVAMLALGRPLFAAMGGKGASLEAAVTYSTWVFSGAVLAWILNSLAAAIRGTGNMAMPAIVTSVGVVVLLPLSPALIFGWGPIPPLGIAGGAIALVLYYAGGVVALALWLRTPRSMLRPSLRRGQLRAHIFRAILRVGLTAMLVSLSTNLTIIVGTALAGHFGPAAVAGYGTGARLEYLLVPLVFGLGAPLVAMVGTNLGAGQRERALRCAWVGGALAFAIAEAIGLAAALFPQAWLRLFDSDPTMLEAGTRYLQIVGPVYGFFGLALSLYFASQGAARLRWPLIGNLARLALASGVGWAAIALGGSLAMVFAAQAVALVASGLVNAATIAMGAWFGPLVASSAWSPFRKRPST